MNDYVTVPAGTYRCRIDDVRPGATRSGDERWSFRLVVADGNHEGRTAAWDAIVFSVRGRARVRRVLAAFALPDPGCVRIAPLDLIGREALATVRPAEFLTPEGETVRRNEVPYDGYHAAEHPDGCGCKACDPGAYCGRCGDHMDAHNLRDRECPDGGRADR